MNKKNLIMIIVVALAVVSTIWLYGLANHDTKCKRLDTNIADSTDSKDHNDEEAASGESGAEPREPVPGSTNRVRNCSDDLQYEACSEDEEGIEKALDLLSDCSDCTAQLKDILYDPSYDETFRHHAAMTLLSSGSREGVLAALDLLLITEEQLQNLNTREEEQMRMAEQGNSLETEDKEQEHLNLREEFLRTIIEMDSLEHLPIFVDVLTGKEESFSNGMIVPDDLRHALGKAIRTMSDQEAVGKLLAELYKSESSPDISNQLLSMGHPGMDALLAAEAYNQDDDEEALGFTKQLEGIEDVKAIDGMMFLTRESDAPVKDIAEMLYRWAIKYPDERNYDVLGKYLSDAGNTPEERAISAYALSGMRDSNRAIHLLQNAYNSALDPLVLKYIEYAFDKIERK